MTGKFTVKEALTAIVVLVVIAAVALPMWHTHQLKIRREDAANALRAVQVAQDDFFALHARYANEAQLRLAAPDSAFGSVVSATTTSKRGYYRISIKRSEDDLTYTAVARALPIEGQSIDTRCVEMRIDQNGRRYAVDASGADRSADCWR